MSISKTGEIWIRWEDCTNVNIPVWYTVVLQSVITGGNGAKYARDVSVLLSYNSMNLQFSQWNFF